jgi:uroporphyrinogen decarboxylase
VDSQAYNSRQMVKTLLDSGKAGRIPKGELCINDDVVCKTMGCHDAGFDERYSFARRLGLDLFSLSPRYPFTGGQLPRPEQFIWTDLGKWADTTLFTFAVLDGAFEWGIRLLGLDKFCVMLRSPLSVEDLVSLVQKLNLSLAQRITAAGIDGFILADDIAYQQGLMASPGILREYFLPGLARQVHEIRCSGLPVFFHSDGNYSMVLDEIVAAGFNGLQCLEKNAGMEPLQIWAKYGRNLCLWGHLDVEDIAAAKDLESLDRTVTAVRHLAAQGQFMLGTTSGLFDGMDLDLLLDLYHSFD